MTVEVAETQKTWRDVTAELIRSEAAKHGYTFHHNLVYVDRRAKTCCAVGALSLAIDDPAWHAWDLVMAAYEMSDAGQNALSDGYEGEALGGGYDEDGNQDDSIPLSEEQSYLFAVGREVAAAAFPELTVAD